MFCVNDLGLERYSILVDGKGRTEVHFLLDLKVQKGSSRKPFSRLPSPNGRVRRRVWWLCRAEARPSLTPSLPTKQDWLEFSEAYHQGEFTGSS